VKDLGCRAYRGIGAARPVEVDPGFGLRVSGLIVYSLWFRVHGFGLTGSCFGFWV